MTLSKMSRLGLQIEHLNEFTRALYLRAYQLTLASGSPLRLHIAESQELIIISHGIYINRHITWLGGFSTELRAEIWLLTAGIIEGFPILKAVELKVNMSSNTIPVGRYIYEYDGNSYGQKFSSDRDALLRQLTSIRHDVEVNWTARPKPLAILGHPNFAHHAWNELSAIEEFVRVYGEVRNLRLAYTHCPLGEVHDIFPEFSRSNISFIQPDKPFTHAELLPFRFGSSRLSTSLSNRVIRHAGRNLSLFGQLAKSHFFSAAESHFLWCTVRNHNRVLLNQEDFYVCLISRMLEHHPNCKVVIDAFSVQADTSQESMSYEGKTYLHVCFLDRIIGRILSRVTQIERNWCDRIISLNGASILDAIYLAKYAHIYVSYPGSVQHKIGWFHTKPGILIGPDNLERKSSWYERCSEPAQRPMWLPPDHILISTLQDDIPPKNRDFMIVDIERSCDFIHHAYGQALLQCRQSKP